MKTRRNITVDLKLWQEALKKAKENCQSLSAIISKYLEKFIRSK